MMAIMLDPHFKSLHIVDDLLGHGNAIRLAIEYDAKIVIPLLMVCFEWLNPIAISASTVATIVNVVVEEFEENMFGAEASIEESSCALVIGEIILFRKLFVLPYACVDPFIWWCIHVTTLALGSQPR
jgi:hypothetical protein